MNESKNDDRTNPTRKKEGEIVDSNQTLIENISFLYTISQLPSGNEKQNKGNWSKTKKMYSRICMYIF
jgi:hypothetical protein